MVVYVDAKSAPLLDGVIVDFVEGVMESGFKFINLTQLIPAVVESLSKQTTVRLLVYLAANEMMLGLGQL